jgi:hypothetical protein
VSQAGGGRKWLRKVVHAGSVVWGVISILAGVAAIIAGVILISQYGPSHAFCDSTGGVLASNGACSTDNFAYYAGYGAIVVGALIIGSLLWARSREPGSSSIPPGWHEISTRPGWVAYWDGQHWIKGTERPPTDLPPTP